MSGHDKHCLSSEQCEFFRNPSLARPCKKAYQFLRLCFSVNQHTKTQPGYYLRTVWRTAACRVNTQQSHSKIKKTMPCDSQSNHWRISRGKKEETEQENPFPVKRILRREGSSALSKKKKKRKKTGYFKVKLPHLKWIARCSTTWKYVQNNLLAWEILHG